MKHDQIIDKLIGYTTKILDYCADEDYIHFSDNSLLVEACVFNLSQMGELANKVDDSFKKMHPEIPWPELYGLRNRIVHDYEGVNLELVWEIIDGDLPNLLVALQSLSRSL